MHIPCDICEAVSTQLVPDRAPDVDTVFGLCPLCFDALLGAFPLRPSRIFQRELTGR